MKIAVDTGGTFTDFVLKQDGHIKFFKLLSSPNNPAEAVLQGLKDFRPDYLIHGTTVATNAFLERKGAEVVLFTTKGFEDVIFIGRQARPKLYDFFVEKPPHFIKPENVYGINERIGSKGEILVSLSKKEIEKAIKWLKDRSVSSVAIVFINSFINHLHERIFKERLEEIFELSISASFEILPEFREYERTSTTTINAYLNPVMKSYLETLKKELKSCKIFIQQSNGGYMSIEEAEKFSVHTILSGPAGGVQGAYKLGTLMGRSKLITFDMGGTSTDVSLIDGEIPFTKEYVIDGFPIGIPVINIYTIGAGGGSIAYIDKGGVLKVGPISAGADPGPACYGKSYLPTVTDANLVLGRLLPDYFFGGKLKLDKERAFQAIKHLAKNLNLSVYETALGIIKIVNTHMARALTKVSIEKGYDPREFTLFCYGGAGGLHVCALAKELKVKEIIIPKIAGAFSALGLYLSHLIKDFSQTVFLPLTLEREDDLKHAVNFIKEKAVSYMKNLGYKEEDFNIRYYADVRYKGQGFELTVPLENLSVDHIKERFEMAHQKQFGFNLKNFLVEIVTLRVKLEEIKSIEEIKFEKTCFRSEVFSVKIFTEKGFQIVPAITWDRLEKEETLKGPLLIIDDFTTVYVEEGFICQVLENYTLWIRKL